MKGKFILLMGSLLLSGILQTTAQPQLTIKYAKLFATYDFVQRLSFHYPDNAYKQVFQNSSFNTQHYRDLITQFDTLNLYESYSFRGYPMGQKIPVMTTSIIQKNLIQASSVAEFKRMTFGIIPNSELIPLSNIIAEFETVYDELVYQPHKEKITIQMKDLENYVAQVNLVSFLEKGLNFYNAAWDSSIPIEISIIQTIHENGFTATAFMNQVMSELPINFKQYPVLFSVFMHEIYHIVYNEQSLATKLQIENWFHYHPSPHRQYAYLLLNEALATAFGNGYVYEQLNGEVDKDDWYFNKYINLMAKAIYPLVNEYADNNKPIDKRFVEEYIAVYDAQFAAWRNEWDHLFTYRFVISDHPDDIKYFRANYPYASFDLSEVPLDQGALERMKATPITKIVVVSDQHALQLKRIKSIFEELNTWEFNAQEEFVQVFDLKDKTRLFIINRHQSALKELCNAYWNEN